MKNARVSDLEHMADPVSVARGISARPLALLQYFSAGTRTLQKSIVAFDGEPIAAGTLHDAVATACRRRVGGEFSGVLVFSGFEELTGLSPEGAQHPAVHGPRTSKLCGSRPRRGNGRNSWVDQNSAPAPSTPIAVEQAGDPPTHPGGKTSMRAHMPARSSKLSRPAALRPRRGALLSVGFSKETSADPFDIYATAVAANPSPYGFVLRTDGLRAGRQLTSFARAP